MRPDIETATARLLAVAERLARRPEHEVRVQEIEDALCDGYAQALAGDAWLAQSERRLHGLLDDATVPISGRDLRTLAGAHQDFQRKLIALRRELAALRDDRDRLQASSRARAS